MARVRDLQKKQEPSPGFEPPPSDEELFDSIEEPESEADPKPVKAKEPVKAVGDDQMLAMKKRLEEFERSSKLVKAQKEDAERQAEQLRREKAENEVRLAETEKERDTSRTSEISNGIAAANAEIEAAEKEMEEAESIGDSKAKSQAIRRMTKASNALDKWEEAKTTFEVKPADQPKPEPQRPKYKTAEEAAAANVDTWPVPTDAKTWLKDHIEYVVDPEKNADINYYHHKIVKDGFKPYSPEYIEEMEVRLGMREAEEEAEPAPAPAPKPVRQRAPAVSAPVSRETPTSNRTQRSSSRRELTPEQVEAARISGVSEAEYARQLERLEQAKANGEYRGRP